ncbi:PREDICTED: myelin-oligodendrocyte glycoprotein-like [Poecilia mexicana]|uniref:myelin-oligodendrocyte glycoprotein-like n=1 Tax=Poecilia mexicana TaxID=48701 RepID=UPI00072DBD5F|nr:PREDICTED: myelin-oligodendrocyte glycoprotein-like [Poecilia mexicana]
MKMLLRVKKTSKNFWRVFIFVLVSVEKVHGGYKVIGVSQPIKAAPGDDVVLPCWVSPIWDATKKTVEWSRLDQRQDSTKKYVLVYRALKLDRRLMMESYIGKASLIPEALKSGNVTLKLTNVTVNDSGRYKCFLPSLKTFAVIQLLVSDSPKTGNLSKPKDRINIESTDERDWWNVLWAPLIFIIIVSFLFIKKNVRLCGGLETSG